MPRRIRLTGRKFKCNRSLKMQHNLVICFIEGKIYNEVEDLSELPQYREQRTYLEDEDGHAHMVADSSKPEPDDWIKYFEEVK